jgi:flagellar hook protein FlgE
MLRSLFSGVSGMKSQQTKMDVIGNNIANANTTAFKASRVMFKDMLSQTMQSASAPADTDPQNSVGGTNAKQVGLGVAIAGVDTDMSQGALQPTSRSTDIAIQGNGFFIVNNVQPSNTVPGYPRFTRDGGFTLDAKGYLVTSEGLHVLGASALDASGNPVAAGTLAPDLSASPSPALDTLVAIKIPLSDGGTPANKLKSFSVEKDGTIRAIYTDNPVVIGKIAVANFQNEAGLEKLGSNLYKNTSNSGTAEVGAPNEKGAGSLEQGFLEMSKVDLANEFTEMIITSRAFQANSRTITTSDEMLQELLNLKR